jgi:hypothetical protein
MKSCAVHMRESSAARNKAICAMSSDISRPGRHWLSSMAFSDSGVTHRRSCFSVITQPGTSVFTRILRLPRSLASERVRPWIAAFVVA